MLGGLNVENKENFINFYLLPIIGGVLYGATYMNKVNGESVQAIKINESNIIKY